MYPESTTDSPARLSLRQTGSPGMIYSARYGSPKRQLQFYRYCTFFSSSCVCGLLLSARTSCWAKSRWQLIVKSKC
ncbi:hypothetical protein MATL_G00080580 [Megalops atlanticus]|uniref:Uncharacterized protein n=1 Tax=Megalops atlanticus TaxID=7932 RepID=A0A9D3QBG2_MEGAT|nr:hypothetical protein MATL_G00080580 [Megalops atlanticus]